MNDRITNHLNMMGAVINVANSNAHRNVWMGQQPTDFGPDFSAFSGEYASIVAAAAAAYAAADGPADAKTLAEDALESIAYTLARACCVHFGKSGDLTRRAQVDFTKSQITRLRDQALVTTSTLIRDIANDASSENGAQNRGVTSTRIASLTAAIDAFTALLSAPRGQIVNRKVMIREVETRAAALYARLPDLDDYVLQFDGTPEGLLFIAAWKEARNIIDAGHGPGETPTPPTP